MSRHPRRDEGSGIRMGAKTSARNSDGACPRTNAAPRRHGRILAIMPRDGLSGIVRPLLHALKQQWDIVGQIDATGIPVLKKYTCAACSFTMDTAAWKCEYHRRLDLYKESSAAMTRRSRICTRELHDLRVEYDLVLQCSPLCIPLAKPEEPYVLYVDRTTMMRERHFPDSLANTPPEEIEQLHAGTRRLFGMADRVLTFNEFTRGSVIDDYGTDGCKVIAVGSGVNCDVPLHLEKLHPPVVLTACSDGGRHGGQVASDAFDQAKKMIPHARFVFIGDRPSRMGDHVECHSFLPYGQLLNWYACASVFVMPSLLGGMQAITEAMAHKCVCIAHAKNPYVADLIVDEENGLLVSSDDPREMADRISSIIEDGERMASIGAKAQQRILERYTWQSVARKMSDCLAELL